VRALGKRAVEPCYLRVIKRIATGPIRTTKRVGKMQPIIGKSIFREAWAAFSSAA
jgi:hypothetical protein